MIKPQIKCKNTPHVNKALVQCTALTKEVIKHSAGWLVKQIWLAAYQIISQWAQPSWNLTSSKRGSFLGFLPSRNPNSSVSWRNRVGDHMPNYEQPYIYSPTVFSHCFHYNRKLCQSCSLRGSSSMSSSQTEQTVWFCRRENHCSSHLLLPKVLSC